MCRTRCKYHYVIQKNKNLKLRKETMAKAISQNNSQQLWDEIKKVRNINPTYSNCVDAAIGADNIVSLFANKYNALYNSPCYEYNEMSNMHNDIRYDIDKYCIKQEDYETLAHTHNISINDVRVAIKHLKKLNLIVLMVYFLIILLMELNCYFLIFLCYLEWC